MIFTVLFLTSSLLLHFLCYHIHVLVFSPPSNCCSIPSKTMFSISYSRLKANSSLFDVLIILSLCKPLWALKTQMWESWTMHKVALTGVLSIVFCIWPLRLWLYFLFSISTTRVHSPPKYLLTVLILTRSVCNPLLQRSTWCIGTYSCFAVWRLTDPQVGYVIALCSSCTSFICLPFLLGHSLAFLVSSFGHKFSGTVCLS